MKQLCAGNPERRLGDRRQPERVVVAAGHQAAASWRAQRGRVEVRVAQASRRDALERRRVAEPAERRELPEADVVPDHHDDVRAPAGGRLGAGHAGDETSSVRPITPGNG